MKSISLILVATLLAMTNVFAAPKAVKTKFFKTVIAGHMLSKDGSAQPVYVCEIMDTAPDIMYTIVEFPVPADETKTYTIRKIAKKSAEEFEVKGEASAGWLKGKIYTYTIHVYSDPDYENRLGQHKQKLEFVVPPGF